MSKPVQKRVLRLDEKGDWIKSELLHWERRGQGVSYRMYKLPEWGVWVHEGLINLKVV